MILEYHLSIQSQIAPQCNVFAGPLYYLAYHALNSQGFKPTEALFRSDRTQLLVHVFEITWRGKQVIYRKGRGLADLFLHLCLALSKVCPWQDLLWVKSVGLEL